MKYTNTPQVRNDVQATPGKGKQCNYKFSLLFFAIVKNIFSFNSQHPSAAATGWQYIQQVFSLQQKPDNYGRAYRSPRHASLSQPWSIGLVVCFKDNTNDNFISHNFSLKPTAITTATATATATSTATVTSCNSINLN